MISPAGPMIHPTAVVDVGAYLAPGAKIWHFSHVAAGAWIGQDSSLGQNCYVAGFVGERCKIQNNVSVYRGVVLKGDNFVGPSAVFCNDPFPRASGEWEIVPTFIGLGASIGANATILPGITLGRHCMVGAGSVVVRDVPDFAIVVGNPARVVRILESCAS